MAELNKRPHDFLAASITHQIFPMIFDSFRFFGLAEKPTKTALYGPRIEFSQRFDRIDVGRQIRTLDVSMGESGGFWEIVFCTGTFERILDDKQRLLLPKPVKKTLLESECLFVTPGQDDCLELHSLESIEQRSAEVTRSQTVRNQKSFSRLYFAQAEKCDLDSQHRIRIPQRLLEWSKLESRVVILGVGGHWEIWSEDHWQEYRMRHKPGFDQAAEAFVTHGTELGNESKREHELPLNPR